MGADRRRAEASSRTHGRRWADDPALRDEFERLMLMLSSDLHTLRERVGWSIEQAAHAAGVDRQTVLDTEKPAATRVSRS